MSTDRLWATLLHSVAFESAGKPLVSGPWSAKAMEIKIPARLNVASGLTLIGEDGVTERTGERSRPLEIWLAKGPNCRMESATAVTIKFTDTEGSLPFPAKNVGPPEKASLPISAIEPTLDPSADVPFNLTESQRPKPLPP